MATYLITGGCGFIGSHLARRLVAEGHVVRVLDDLSTGKADWAPRGSEMIVGSILDAALLERAMGGVDGCFHLAAITSVQACHRDPVATHRVNLTGSLAVFHQARQAGGVPVVYASSAAVYGEAHVARLSETSTPLPLSTYGVDKLSAELHASLMSRYYGVPTVGFRFFNVYGPRQDPRSPYSGVISIFYERLRSGQPLIIHGDGEQTRDFIHIADVVPSLAASVHGMASAPAVFNLCTGAATTINELARLVALSAGMTPQILRDAPRAGDIRHSVGDPTQARERLGFRPAMRLDEGLLEMAASVPARG